MKRDMDLVRSILIAIEGNETPSLSRDDFYRRRFKEMFPSCPPWNDIQIVEHVRIMEQAGLIKVDGVMGPRGFSSLGLEWEGHEFIANARNEDVWKKAKNMFGDTSLAVLKQGLVKIATGVLIPENVP